MSYLSIRGVRLAGVSAAVPMAICRNIDTDFVKSTGVIEKRESSTLTVYGISLAASLISSGHGSTMKRALLIAGPISKEDIESVLNRHPYISESLLVQFI